MPDVWINDPQGKSVAVVFVHGVLSSSETCWTNENGKSWPRILQESLHDKPVAVYTFSYNTSFTSGSYNINDAADAMNECLRLDGILDFPLVIFVCHSMGGLVVRRFLVQRQYENAERKFGIFLVASPSLGADYANWLAPVARLAGHAQADALRVASGNPWLSTLNSDFSRLVRNRHIIGREIVEDESIFTGNWIFRTPVVTAAAGAIFFSEPLRIPKTNHFTIAKPANGEALQQRMLREFILESIDVAGSPTRSSSGANADAVKRTKRVSQEELQRLILHATHEEKVRIVGMIPYGPGVSPAKIHPDILRSYTSALSVMQASILTANAANIVLAADPSFSARPELVTVTQMELSTNSPPQEVVWTIFQVAAVKGPRMLAALLLYAPAQAVASAGQEILKLLRDLGVEV